MKEKILNIVLELIEESGISSVSMRNIADELEMSATALYRHFKNKDDILFALGKKGYSKLLKEIIVALSADNPMKRLERSYFILLAFYFDQKALFLIMNGFYFSEHSNIILEMMKFKKPIDKFIQDRIRELIIDKDLKELDADKIFVILNNILNGTAFSFQFEQHIVSETTILNRAQDQIKTIISKYFA